LAFKVLKLTYLLPKEANREVLVNENPFLAKGIPDCPILSYIMEQKSQEFCNYVATVLNTLNGSGITMRFVVNLY